MIHRLPTKINQNKPIYTWFSILELSKAHMYRFHYNVVLAKYGLQTAIYRHRQFLLPHKNGRRVQWHADFFGRLRHQLVSQRQRTRCTQDSVQFWENSKTNVTALPPWSSWDGVPKCTLCWCRDCRRKLPRKESKSHSSKKHVKHDMFLHTLKNKSFTTAKFLSFRSRNHTIHTQRNVKICLSSYDDKRYLFSVGVNSLAYGHYRVTCDVGIDWKRLLHIDCNT